MFSYTQVMNSTQTSTAERKSLTEYDVPKKIIDKVLTLPGCYTVHVGIWLPK
jgi:hypothetical protein